MNYQSISLPALKPELLLTSAPVLPHEAPRCWEGIILMGGLCARPASIRTARLLNKATGAGFLLGRLTRSTYICLVLIIIDKLQRIMCGAGRGCSSSQLPVQPPPMADALEWICALALMEHQGCFPPGTCAAPQLLSEHFQLWSVGEWRRACADTLVAFVAAGTLLPSHPFPKGCCGSPTFGSVFSDC